MSRLRRCITRLGLPAAWRLSPGRKSTALGAFAITELDSAWQSLHAFQNIDDVGIRAQLFQHALEEIDHASRFERVFDQVSSAPLPATGKERKPLFDRRAGDRALVEFFAYECAGERAIHGEFRTFAHAVGDVDVRAVFESVEADEAGHVLYTGGVLARLVGGDVRRQRRALARARLRRWWEAWLRGGRAIGVVPIVVVLTVLYGVFGPILRRRCRRLLGEVHVPAPAADGSTGPPP